MVIKDEWKGCYKKRYGQDIVAEAYAHPAKMARRLMEKVFEHVIAEGWADAGSLVVDPFGGIGTTALGALMNGMRVVTCELEEKFVSLSKENRELWRAKFTGLPGFDADNWIILQGDSRNLATVISEAGIVVSSPPYSGSEVASACHSQNPDGRQATYKRAHGFNGYDAESEGQLGAMREGDLTLAVSSPPYASGEKGHPSLGSVNNDDWGHDGRDITRRRGKTGEYGDADGQIASLPVGDVGLVVSSPPFSQPETRDRAPVQQGTISEAMTRAYTVDRQSQTNGNLAAMPLTDFDVAITSPPYNPPMSQDHNGARGGKRGTEPSETGAFVKYGNSEGQIEGLSMEGFECAVSSPPYEAQDVNLYATKNQGKRFDELTDAEKAERRDGAMGWYGTRNLANSSDGQISNLKGDTFWSASRTILEQLYSVLTPGAHAIFIVKAFVRNKQIVDFPAQWAQLCEAVGFKLIHDHHALLTEHSGTQSDMFGADKEIKVKRVSFFRRLHEKRAPETEIFYENVLCFVRPQTQKETPESASLCDK